MLLDPLIMAFGIIALGYFSNRALKFDLKTLSNALLFVFTPCLTFSALYTKKFAGNEFGLLSAASITSVIAGGIFAFAVFRAMKYRGKGLLLPAMFMNSGYLGFPLVLFAFGQEGLGYAIIFDAVETVLIFTLGVYIAQKSGTHFAERASEIFRIPLIYAILLGLALNFGGVALPKFLVDGTALLGNASIPLALVALGARLSSMKIGKIELPLVAVFSRIAIGGFAGFAFIWALGIQGTLAAVILLLSVMPPAVNSYVINEKYSCEPDGAATAVFIGTLLSIIPIALVLGFYHP